jgi:hypothetical protein
MATLYVTEYATGGFAQVGGAVVQTAHEPPLAEQTVSIGGSSAASSAFNAATTLVRLHADAICSILFGTSPTAAAAKQRFAANQTEYKTVPRGQSYKVAVITNS